jgi:glycosyltransferase involved in cell wall biosynthesis
VFYRCPITDEIEEFIKECKERNKVIFYDVDDLVIDRKYTDKIEFIQNMSKTEYDVYTDGVNRMGKVLKMCDYAITTTDDLAKELQSYVKEVFINRNVASEEMAYLSQEALKNKKYDAEKIVMGYLSGSITHNPDFNLILPSIKEILKKYDNVYLKVVGILDIPEELEPYKNKIIIEDFVDYKKLPEIIASIDINLAPLEDTLFNKCKSENKWMEASLVKTVTIASNVGAFKTAIKNNITGILCNDDEWLKKLESLIENSELRKKLANNAYDVVMKKYITTYTGLPLTEFIKSKMKKAVSFVLPTTNISGGVNVILKHASILRKYGYDVFILNSDVAEDDIIFEKQRFGVISIAKNPINCHFDNMVASLWTTAYYVQSYSKTLKKSYLVQGFETDFMKYGDYRKQIANSTYNLDNINYLTVSKWCEQWLKEDYHNEVKYVPNGIDLEKFTKVNRKFEGKIKVLVEGNSEDYFKNVDESFKIVDLLDKDKFEITYLSYQGEPKKWYYYDKFMHKVPFDVVQKVYQEHDVLIKSSIFESFSYPPLEMMATGGIVLVAPNDGNIEYIKDNFNCITYNHDNLNAAVEKLNKVIFDEKLRKKIQKNAQDTVNKYDWKKIEKDIIKLYF